MASIGVTGNNRGTAQARFTLFADPAMAASSFYDPGAMVVIDAGYDTVSNTIFSGVLQSVGLETAPDGKLVLIVEATGAQAPATGTASAAARMGDTTAHGGTIMLGLPTVMIGE